MGARVTSEQRRSDLIAVALRQYVALGIDATTRSSLAAELGVDRVIVHRLYPDLDDLFGDVVDHVRTVGVRVIDDAAATVGRAETSRALWHRLIGSIVREARANPDEWDFLFVVPTRAAVAEQLADLRADIARRVVHELVAHADTEGPPDHRQQVERGATFLYHGLFGSIAQHLADGTADDEVVIDHLAGIVDALVGPVASATLPPTP